MGIGLNVPPGRLAITFFSLENCTIKDNIGKSPFTSMLSLIGRRVSNWKMKNSSQNIDTGTGSQNPTFCQALLSTYKGNFDQMRELSIYLLAEITHLKGQRAFLQSQTFSYAPIEHLGETESQKQHHTVESTVLKTFVYLCSVPH